MATPLIVLLVGCGTAQRASHTGAPKAAAAIRAAARVPTTARHGTPPSPRQPAAQRRAPLVIKPRIVWDPSPFGPRRKAETVAYAERHYGLHTYRLINLHVIVIHYTDVPSFASAYNTFAPTFPTASCTNCRASARIS